jgi:hypothetical protein
LLKPPALDDLPETRKGRAMSSKFSGMAILTAVAETLAEQQTEPRRINAELRAELEGTARPD